MEFLYGVTVKNFAKWLHRTKKNIKMLASASTMEYKAFLEGGYGYSEDVVKLTGFARFDLLEDRSERLISIMPTWRKDIAADHVALTEDDHVMVRGYSNSFVDTDYYKFYQGLIGDER